MNKIKSKKVHIAIVVMALLFLTGGYFAHSFMETNNNDANISKASAKTDAIKETDASEQKKAQKDKKYVLEDNDSLKVTVTDVDVSVYWENDIIKREIHDSWLERGVLG